MFDALPCHNGVGHLIGVTLIGVAWTADAIGQANPIALLDDVGRLMGSESYARCLTKGDARAVGVGVGPDALCSICPDAAHLGTYPAQVVDTESCL